MPPRNQLPRQDLQLIADTTVALWEEMRGQNLFITGGTGFFGCWLVESFCFINRLLSLNSRLTVLTRDPSAFAQKCPHIASDSAVTLLGGDVRSFAFPNGEYRYVIHAATEANPRQAAEAPLEMLSTIIAGTEHTLEFATSHGGRKFLLTSSGAVYGKQPSDLTHLPETYQGAPDPLDPASVYGEGKRTAETLCAVYHKTGQLECKIARCWAFCGPGLPLDQHFAIGNFIGDILARRPIHIQGDGTARRSYLYAADLAVWLWTMLFRAPGLVPFNIGSAHEVGILELAETVTATLNPKTEIHVALKATPGAAPQRYVPCVERAHDLLGLRQTVTLEESIRRTAIWHMK
jgi:nucleoside-diphosphate-sugar epimerase